MQPRFLTFEGGEGAGKSTQITLLAAAFSAAGTPCLVTREPGGSEGAEAIRSLVVTGAVDRWHPATEALLFMAARHDHIETRIRPALASGSWVLCDRFYDSTYVYQGIAKRVGGEWLDGLYNHLYGNLQPDLTLLLDIHVEQGLARAASRAGNETRFESMDMAFHTSLREGFLALAATSPKRIHVLDAAQPVEALHAQIISAVNQRFSLSLVPQSA